MKTPDIIISILAIVVAAIVVYLIKRRKKGGCASCPYNKTCSTQNCGCPSQGVKKEGQEGTAKD